MESFEIIAQLRTDKGKGASRRLRHNGFVPAIIYGAGKEPVSLSISQNEILKHLDNEAFYSQILTVNIDGQSEKVILKDLQRHPYRPSVMHLDLQRVSETQKLQMRVPLRFINAETCIGVKQGGGVISHQMSEVEISCLPKDLPEFIEVDLKNIKLNEVIHLSDLVSSAGVELLGQSDQAVISVHLARGEKEETEEEVTEESAADNENKEG
jgi:large subunit ribosomal protein L25